MKAEKILNYVADSTKMPGWNDSLSFVVDSVTMKSRLVPLCDEDLEMVAAGVDVSEEMIKKLKLGMHRK